MFSIHISKIKVLKRLSIIVLATCCLVFVISSRQWPLVNDAALIRYVTFLLEGHLAPYRQIYDINMPGSYLVDWTVTHFLGNTALAWRIFDLVLLAAICWAMFSLARLQSRFAGIYAGTFFALFHARNGIAQLGQRDLTMTALLLVGSSCLLKDKWHPAWIRFACFGLFVGLSATIKPQAILFLLVASVPYLSSIESRTANLINIKGIVRAILVSALTASIPIIGVVIWLSSRGAIPAFWTMITSLIPLHARLGAHSFFYLLSRCLTASHATILVLAVSLGLTAEREQKPSVARNRVRLLLICGMMFGFLSYMMQVKSYPYHRYPFVAFLSLFAALEFTYALNASGARQLAAIVGITFGLTLSVLYTIHSLHDTWQTAQVDSLEVDLNSLGGATLSGNIQCVDTIDGCLATLYRLRLTQSTGNLYDEFLFLPPNIATARQAGTIADMQKGFLHTLSSAPPYVIVLTPWLFPGGPTDYKKLQLWPAFENILAQCYEMRIERHILGRPPDHPGYRIYVRLPTCKKH